MTDAPVRVGTRASKLALSQSAWAARHLGVEFELVHVSTHGDRDQTSPLTQIGGTGVFVSAVREALLSGEVDVVVHSLKDLPTAEPDGIRLAAVPPRESPSDALIARDGLTLETLPAGASVGTGSPRRAAQLRLQRPDLDVQPIRGNIDTRIANVTEGRLDAVVLAAAGLNRLGLTDRVTDEFDPTVFLPAPAQGALAVEVREDDHRFDDALAALDCPVTRAAVTAERQLLNSLEAGCSAPVAAYAVVDGAQLRMQAGTYGSTAHMLEEAAGPMEDPRQLGRRMAETMLGRGARDLLSEGI
ncbi:hydroxymethylbilane synthase [Helcobacillus massiliensis]|uniref:Porphobilinogen deaminase n=1 Tax=Helcobacillus massiliensis TaxID=521392 RepID=A0A839QWJ1_9MICO|nr:hydroxymethylbilane synthase [Helcobacillus massiliensis]MBB3023160.1 hydroxymethylbilane synthase [Helcobacillus massiliensis]